MKDRTKAQSSPQMARALAFLQQHQISYTLHRHTAIQTTTDTTSIYRTLAGVHCKNLFLQEKKGKRLFLVIIPTSKRLPLQELAQQLHTTKLCFAAPSCLLQFLGVTPGSVSPLGLLYDTTKKVELVIDQTIWEAKHVTFHPNDNTATVVLGQLDFRHLIGLLTDTFVLSCFQIP